MKILVTGGAGFIGSEFVRKTVKNGYDIIVVDKLTYAGDIDRLKEVEGKFKFYKTDICDISDVDIIFDKEKPEVIAHFAAESHVDRSILNAIPFTRTNIIGTQNLLNVSRKYNVNKFLHISTDEVYGEIEKGNFYEDSPLRPNSPYAASKAAADLYINSYIRTYDFPAIIIRPSNNYGPWQYPEKLIPVIIYKAINEQRVPVYGEGENIREWLYVSDCINAIIKILEEGKVGEIYNIGCNQEKRNIDTVKQILKQLGKSEKLIQFVEDRPGHDYRYSLNFDKLKALGWQPQVNFEKGIGKVVSWYKENYKWLESKAIKLKNYWSRIYKIEPPKNQ